MVFAVTTVKPPLVRFLRPFCKRQLLYQATREALLNGNIDVVELETPDLLDVYITYLLAITNIIYS
ncbi:hypothetical protein HYDPIDRAFT_116384 [Hydnomerulius pinastri MD-312]|uniref:Uncharacterized protein n=1 Tax=Hydnomerulius pinastri MD-312 TaxID=994086 RepID=A0A0C9WBU5_9AGAM|nr:hypothetical protein HYDPIDRAFT_116384 [Hydnomerulius pinastri MD-312]